MKRRTKEQWRELIGEFEMAGLTQVEFARLYGVNVGTFRVWLHRLRRAQALAPVRFAEVSVSHASEKAPPCRLELPGDVVVLLGSAPEPRWLAELVVQLAGVR